MRAQTSSARRGKARREAGMPRVLTLSVALAAIGLIAAAPASAANDRKEVETRVKITRVSSHIVSPVSGAPYASYSVKGVVHSLRPGCRIYRPVTLIHHQVFEVFRHFTTADDRPGWFWQAWPDLTVPFTQQHDRVKVPRSPSYPDGRFICEGDRSPRFTIPPPSEAGIAAATEGES